MAALNTAIFVQGPQDALEIYHTALQQILFYDGRNASPSDISFQVDTDTDGREILYAPPHEHLPAMLGVYHRPGGMMFTEQEAKEKFDSGCPDRNCVSHRPEPAHLIVAFGTNIFWADEGRKWNAGNLHGGLLWSIGGFLDSKQLPWKWQENISHSTHEGYEELDNLVAAVENVRTGMANPLGIGQVISREIMKRMGFTLDEG